MADVEDDGSFRGLDGSSLIGSDVRKTMTCCLRDLREELLRVQQCRPLSSSIAIRA